MAIPLQAKTQQRPSERPLPKSVQAVKLVDLALVSYTDDSGLQHVQLAIIGDNNVNLISGRMLGLSDTATQGLASDWLKKAIFEKLGRK
jgi:hypothetical protein